MGLWSETVTYERVASLAEELLKKGENPSTLNIRIALGDKGSLSTLTKHLNEWKAEKIRQAVLNTALPSDALSCAVQKIWQQMHEETELKITQIQSEARHAVEAAQAAQQHAEAAQDSFRIENERLQEEINAIKEQLTQAQQAEELAMARLEETHRALELSQTAQQQAGEEKRALLKTQAQLTQEITTLREQLAQSRQEATTASVRLAEQTTHHQTRLQDKETQLAACQAEKERLLEQIGGFLNHQQSGRH